MSEMELFQKQAAEFFGAKVMVGPIIINENILSAVNEHYHTNYTTQEFIDYGTHVWLLGDKCPVCGANLLGLFGSFEWGIRTGCGSCSSCNRVEFRYVHYIPHGKKSFPFHGFSIIGFDDGSNPEDGEEED